MISVMSIKFKVYEMMAQRGIPTRRKLAEMTGIAPWRIGEFVKGTPKMISLETLNKLCTALDCQPGELLEFTPDEPDAE